MKSDRRDFFYRAGIGMAAIAGFPLLTKSCTDHRKNKRIASFFSPGDVVLFQGDSITDAGRDRDRGFPNDAASFGVGYAALLASWLLDTLPGHELTLYNRGISGNKVFQLDERWDEDCLLLKPDILSILIGVNDYWHMRNGRYNGTPEIYENDYRALLGRTREQLPEVKLVICQPYILAGTKVVDNTWIEAFKPYQEAAERLAGEFGAVWVPFQRTFTGATEMAPPAYWTNDGVHPSMAGSQLMAESWLGALV